MCKSFNVDLDAKPTGCTPNAECFGAFQPESKRRSQGISTSIVEYDCEER